MIWVRICVSWPTWFCLRSHSRCRHRPNHPVSPSQRDRRLRSQSRSRRKKYPCGKKKRERGLIVRMPLLCSHLLRFAPTPQKLPPSSLSTAIASPPSKFFLLSLFPPHPPCPNINEATFFFTIHSQCHHQCSNPTEATFLIHCPLPLPSTTTDTATHTLPQAYTIKVEIDLPLRLRPHSRHPPHHHHRPRSWEAFDSDPIAADRIDQHPHF